jgi:hypothetical protein
MEGHPLRTTEPGFETISIQLNVSGGWWQSNFQVVGEVRQLENKFVFIMT